MEFYIKPCNLGESPVIITFIELNMPRSDAVSCAG